MKFLLTIAEIALLVFSYLFVISVLAVRPDHTGELHLLLSRAVVIVMGPVIATVLILLVTDSRRRP